MHWLCTNSLSAPNPRFVTKSAFMYKHIHIHGRFVDRNKGLKSSLCTNYFVGIQVRQLRLVLFQLGI